MDSHAAAPDWTRFRAAMTAGTAQGEIPRACELAFSWLDLTPDERHARVAKSIRDETHARWMLQALPFVRLRLSRQGEDEARRFDATVAIGKLVADRFTAAVQPPPAPDPYREALAAATPALSAAIHGVDIGAVAAAKVETLERAIEAFAAQGQGAPADVACEFAWWLATAWWTMGRARLELGRNDEGRAAFERAGSFSAQAGDAASVEACRQRVRDLDAHIAADFDAAADRERRAILVRQDPMGRAKALARLAMEVGSTGDHFGAAPIARDAAKVLVKAGYADPERDFDAATARWIDTAAATLTGNTLFARVCEVAALWGAILGARANAAATRDPGASDRAQRALARIPPFSAALFEQSGRAGDEAMQKLEAWYPSGAPPLDRPDLAPALKRAEALAEIDSALLKLRAACNKRPAKRQVAAASKLRARAQALGSRVHVVRAIVEEMHALLALHREDDALPLADLAIATLFDGRRPALGAFATRYERELYLTAIDYKARALAAKDDDDAILALCEPVVRDIETERTRVSSPYQQSAFLATRVEIYEFVAAAAYRTGKLDLLLEVSELLKARAALGGRAPSPPSISIASIQQTLAADEAAITWFFAGTHTLIVLGLRRDGSRPTVVTLDPTHHGQLRDYLACVTALGVARPDYAKLVPRIDELVVALGALLLPADIRNFIAGASRLVLCPHRALHLFPFHAAPWMENDATQFVIERFGVRYVPNLTSLLVPWQGNRDGPVLAVGVARFADRRAPPLPKAKAEAEAIAKAHGSLGRALINPTREQFTSLPLADFRCLHFATHGSSVLAASDDPMQSSIWFADGPLTGWQIASLPLRASLVVLAACHSGQRAIAGRGLDMLPGDDLFGLAGALFQAGVNTVLGTLWPVQDEAAKALVIAFHHAYAQGDAPAGALCKAVRAHLAQRRHARDVFFWAPFFVSSLGCA